MIQRLGHLIQTITGNLTESDPVDGVRAISLNPDGRILAVATHETVIRLWDTRTGKVETALAGHTNSVGVVKFSPEGNLIASGGDDGTLRLWDVETG